jgi:hypothetical protein
MNHSQLMFGKIVLKINNLVCIVQTDILVIIVKIMKTKLSLKLIIITCMENNMK